MGWVVDIPMIYVSRIQGCGFLHDLGDHLVLRSEIYNNLANFQIRQARIEVPDIEFVNQRSTVRMASVGHLHAVIHFHLTKSYAGSLCMIHKCMIEFEGGHSHNSSNVSRLYWIDIDLGSSLAQDQIFFCGDDLFEIRSIIDV